MRSWPAVVLAAVTAACSTHPATRLTTRPFIIWTRVPLCGSPDAALSRFDYTIVALPGPPRCRTTTDRPTAPDLLDCFDRP